MAEREKDDSLTRNRIKSSNKPRTSSRRKRGRARGGSTRDEYLYRTYIDLPTWPLKDCVPVSMSRDELSRVEAGDSSPEEYARTRIGAALAAGHIEYTSIQGDVYVNKVQFVAWLIYKFPWANRLAMNPSQVEGEDGDTLETEMPLLARILQLDKQFRRASVLASRDMEIRMDPKCRGLASSREMDVRLDVLELANDLLFEEAEELHTSGGRVNISKVTKAVSAQWVRRFRYEHKYWSPTKIRKFLAMSLDRETQRFDPEMMPQQGNLFQ